jgi:hypothetical protein
MVAHLDAYSRKTVKEESNFDVRNETAHSGSGFPSNATLFWKHVAFIIE